MSYDAVLILGLLWLRYVHQWLRPFDRQLRIRKAQLRRTPKRPPMGSTRRKWRW